MIRRLSLALTLAVFTIAGARAGDVAELRYATAAPEQTPWGVYLKEIVDVAEKTAEGTMKSNVFWSSQLGDEQTTLRQVVRGRIDMSGQSNTATSLVVPEIALLAAPYLFENVEQSDCVFDNHVGTIFGPMLAEKGLILLSYVEVGRTSVFSTVPMADPAAAQGVKLRVPPTNAVTLFWKDVGAAGVPLGVVDMVPALKTGQVKAIHTTTVYGMAIGLPKLAPYVIYDSVGTHDVGTVTVSKKVWNRLTDKQRRGLEVTANYVDDLRRSIRGAETALLGKAEEAGAKVTRTTGDARESWRAHAQATHDALIREIGDTAPPIWKRILAAKKACASS